MEQFPRFRRPKLFEAMHLNFDLFRVRLLRVPVGQLSQGAPGLSRQHRRNGSRQHGRTRVELKREENAGENARIMKERTRPSNGWTAGANTR